MYNAGRGESLKHGRPSFSFFWQRPHPLLWVGSLAACKKEKNSYIHNCRHYGVISYSTDINYKYGLGSQVGDPRFNVGLRSLSIEPLTIKLHTRDFVCLLEGNYVLCTAESWAGLYRCEIEVLKNFNKGSSKTPVYGKIAGEKINEIFRVRNFRETPVRKRCSDTDVGTFIH